MSILILSKSPRDESLATEQQYETFVDNLANEYKELINVAY